MLDCCRFPARRGDLPRNSFYGVLVMVEEKELEFFEDGMAHNKSLGNRQMLPRSRRECLP